jgi:hypothetical protein
MSLEINSQKVALDGRSLCGGCFTFANSPNVVPGGPIMVAPKSETATLTGLGQSPVFGKVRVSHSEANAYAEIDRRIHLVVRLSVKTANELNRSGKFETTHAVVAHDLKPLP